MCAVYRWVDQKGKREITTDIYTGAAPELVIMLIRMICGLPQTIEASSVAH